MRRRAGRGREGGDSGYRWAIAGNPCHPLGLIVKFSPPTLSPRTLPQRWRQRPWARGHGQPGVSWRRSQLPLPVSPVSAAAAPDHRSRVGQSGVRRANPPAQAWQRQQPAAAAAASGEPAPRGGGRAGAARSSSARRRSFPNSPSPRAPRASRASGGQLWHAMAMATRPRTLPHQRFGRVGRGWGGGDGGRGGGLLAG